MLVWRCVTTTTAYFIVYSTWIQCQPTKMKHTHTQKKLWYVCVCVETLIHPSHPSSNNKSQTHNDNSNNNNNNEKASAHIATSTLCVCTLKSIRERYGNRQLVVVPLVHPLLPPRPLNRVRWCRCHGFYVERGTFFHSILLLFVLLFPCIKNSQHKTMSTGCDCDG